MVRRSLQGGVFAAADLRSAGEPPVTPVGDLALQRRILDRYTDELAGLSPEAAAAWLLQRLAAMEAMQLTLNSGVRLMDWGDPGPAAVQALDPVQPEAEPPLPAEAAVTCDREMLQEGFYDAEVSAAGSSFRWIGPEPRAAVFLPRVAQPAEIRLHLQSAFCPEVLGEVRVALDGGAWATVTLEEGPEGRVLIAQPPPPEEGRAGAMRLDIDVVRTDSPLNRGQSDPRMLGIALRQIEARSV